LCSWLFLSSLGVAGCAHTQAKTVPEAPLEMPAPPPRSVEPVDFETPQPVPLPEEPARRAPPRRQPPPRPEPKADVKPEPPKPDTPPIEPPKPVEEPAKPPTLQMTPAANEAELERSIRSTLVRANTDLKRVDFGRLNAEARTQYDFANRYIQQAEDALSKKNLVFAEAFAKKAADIAVQLAGK
jgi:outer membrane biosynthesis protein TonB